MDPTIHEEHDAIPTSHTKYKSKFKISTLLSYQYECDNPAETEFPHVALKELKYTISKPYVLYNPVLSEQVHDPYLSLVHAKYTYNTHVEALRTAYRRKLKKKICNLNKLDYYEKMQDLLNKDPDKYFNGDYNWYYSGGNLDTVQVGSNNLVFHTSQGSELCATKISKPKSQWKVDFQKRLTPSDDNIFELKSVVQNNDVVLGVRHKTSVKLYRVTKYDSPHLSCKLLPTNISSENSTNAVPLVGVCLNSYKFGQYAILNAQQMVQIRNIRNNLSKSFRISKIINTVGENWAQLNYLDENLLMYTNNLSYNITDLRTSNVKNAMLATELLHKEQFTNVCLNSNINNYVHMTSNKNVIEIDLRMHKIVSKWSHSFKKSVFLSDSISDSEHFISVASQYPYEKLLLSCNKNSINIPVLVPTVTESLDQSLAYKPSINMSHCIRMRALLSTTGLKFVKHSDNVSLLTSNSIGDIFVNEIKKDETKNNSPDAGIKKNAKTFHNFGYKVLDNIDKSQPLNVIDKVVVKELCSVLNNKPPNMDDHLKARRQKCIARVMKTLKHKIDKCKTTLSAAWDIGTEIEDIAEMDSTTNVEMWLSSLNPADDKTNDHDSTIDENSGSNFIGNFQKSLTKENNDNNEYMFDELHTSVSQNIF